MRRTGGLVRSIVLSLSIATQGAGTSPVLSSSRVRETYCPVQACDTPGVRNNVTSSEMGTCGPFKVTSILRCGVDTKQVKSEIGGFLEEIKKDDGSPALSPEQIRDTVEKLEKQEIVTLEQLKKVTEEKMERWGIPGGRATIIYAELQKAFPAVPMFDPINYDFKLYLDSQINNKDDVSLLERDAQLQSVQSVLAIPGDAKPNAVTLFSGRGSGKTSFLRQVALSPSTLDARNCGRVLVRDLAKAPLKTPS